MKDDKKKKVVREQPMTYEDYANLPDDGKRYELVDGRLEFMGPAPTAYHQLVSLEIQKQFLQHCEEEYFIFNAPIDVIFSDTVVMQPDLALVRRDRFASVVRKRGIVGTPDLIVEILSPVSVKRDRGSKLITYAEYKVPEYWIVDPSNQILEQYVLDNDQYALPPKMYTGKEAVQSESIRCVSFTLQEILANIPRIPDD